MPVELVAGTVIADRFRLDRELGQGGMGAVWAATHQVTHKQIALKFMHSKSPEMTARFIREAQTASAVRHPNVVDIHDVLPLPDGTPLMVMEMLQGESLADRLTREGRLSPLDTAQIMIPVISAVGAAHAAGIVHRDLKPENIYLARYGQTIVPKVLDFGIAKVVTQSQEANASNLTRTGSMLGTPYYMSPEQVYGEKDVDARADIWSLGIILYQALVGKRPFDGDNFGQLLKAVTVGMFEPVERTSPWVPAPVVNVINGMIRERTTRLTNLGEVEHALMSCVPMATGSLPMMSGSQPRLPNVQSSGGFIAASPYMAQSSGGFPAVAMTPSNGVPIPAGTPPPMVRSQTMLLVSDENPVIKPRPLWPIAGGIGAACALVGVIAFAIARSHSTPTTAASAGLVSTGVVSEQPVIAAPSAVPEVKTSAHTDVVAATPTPQTTSTSTSHALAVASTAAPTPSSSASAHSNGAHHGTGGTGGLSTDVPF